jgi:uncharacterized membrane protein/uncharacterized membrane protein YeaQ/YmgE (transglycosylase-associated protein family)
MEAVATWIATGLIVGWLVRTAMKSRGFGLMGDLTTGSLGALVGGWLLRSLHIVAPNNEVGHIAVALFGAMALLGMLRVLRRLTDAAGLGPLVPAGPLTLDLEAQVRRLSEFERRLLSTLLQRQRVTPDPNTRFDAQMTFGDRIADRVATFGGSWTFIGLFLTVLVAWMAINEQIVQPFDPFPYILLNLLLSCIAALQAPVIMMSQNRQAAKDRSDARSDYEVNLRAEMQIMALHEKVDGARQQDRELALRLLEEHGRLLSQIESRLARQEAGGRRPGWPPCEAE